MSAKTSAARREAFFRALAATGNQTLAAERAKVSRSWVSLHRSTDPAFRAAMDAATAIAKEQLRAGATVRPDAGWRAQDGEELVVRGSNGRRAQIARAQARQWTPRLEARFLAALAASCNVRAACGAAGLTVASAYGHYHRWPAFAQRWNTALGEGYARLEAALIENACNAFSPPDFEADAPMPPVTVDQALRLLALHRRRVDEHPDQPHKRGHVPVLDDAMCARIRTKLERFEHTMAREDADPAADRRALPAGARIVVRRGG